MKCQPAPSVPVALLVVICCLYLLVQVREQVKAELRDMIVRYREDADLQNLIDWVQQDWVSINCC